MLEFLETRSPIRVTLQRNMKVYPKTTEYGDNLWIIITAANRGQRNVFISGAGIVVRRKHGKKAGGFAAAEAFRNANEPLPEGAGRDFFLNMESIEKEQGYRSEEYIGYVSDRTGRTFYSHNWIQRLIRIRRFC